jgi:hypothetical protein
VLAGGIRFASRRFGQDTGMPLVFVQHFRGGMDGILQAAEQISLPE